MRTLRWRRIRNLAAMGLIGLSTIAAQAFDQRPIRLSNLQEVFKHNDQFLVLGQGSESSDAVDADVTGGDAAGCCDDGCDCIGDWRDNTVVWFGADAYKSIGDTGRPNFNPTPFALHNSFGLVSGFNTGFRLGDSALRGQVGASYGVYDFKGRTTDPATPTDDSLEQQTYVTFGVSKRSDINTDDPISWGVVYDQFVGHQWGWKSNEIYLSQFRYIAGYALNECNELGVWGTFQSDDDTAQLNFIFPTLTLVHPMNQVNGYLRHNWEFGASAMAYLGVVDHADNGSWLFGLLADSPLSNRTSLYGNFTYVAPSSATGLVGVSEEQWNVSVGLQVSLGGKAVSPTVSGQRGLPLLPVANNGSFLITD